MAPPKMPPPEFKGKAALPPVGRKKFGAAKFGGMAARGK